MMRTLHRWPGLVLAALLSLMALSGAALSLFPALEAVQAPTVPDRLSVAELAQTVTLQGRQFPEGTAPPAKCSRGSSKRTIRTRPETIGTSTSRASPSRWRTR